MSFVGKKIDQFNELVEVADADIFPVVDTDQDETKYISKANLFAGYYTQAEVDALNAGFQLKSEKGQANGYTPLDGSGKIASQYIPAIALSEVYVVADIAERDALDVQEGDFAIVTDINTTYVYDGSSWIEVSAGGDVLSVNGQTGVVSLDSDDIAEGLNNLYFTDLRVSQNADVVANTASRHDPVTILDSDEIDFTLLGQQITGSIKNASIAAIKLDASINSLLSLAGSSLQPNDNISELTNDLGYIINLDGFNTDDLAEGLTNLYYTQGRFNADFSTKDTDDLSEGSLNLYFTNARVDTRISLQKGNPDGLATLNSSGKIPTSQLPALALTDVFVVSSEVDQLALNAQEGDVAVRTDENKSYIHNGGTAGTMADWQEMLTPTDSVLSVNGQTGIVTLTTTHITEGSNLYFTDSRAVDALNGENISIFTNDSGYISDITTEVLGDLADVSLTSIAAGEILKWSGTAWINNTLAEAGISAVGHTHDDRYYTESEVDTLLSSYALLAGRSGGQTLIGGTASGDDLTLQSTSNSTKGSILFGTSAYDEVNNRLGIGIASPSYELHVVGDIGTDQLIGTGASGQLDISGRVAITASLTNGNGLFDLISNTANARWRFQATDSSGAFIFRDAASATNPMFIAKGTPSNTFIVGAGGVSIGVNSFAASATNALHIFNGTAPTGSVTNGVILYSEDVAASAELKVRDEAGNITTLSPHNFSKIPEGKSEDMAWSFYSERQGRFINVDMTRAIRLIEKLSGEQLIYIGEVKKSGKIKRGVKKSKK